MVYSIVINIYIFGALGIDSDNEKTDILYKMLILIEFFSLISGSIRCNVIAANVLSTLPYMQGDVTSQ